MHRKTYEEINLNEKLFGKNFIVYDWKESDDEIHIYVKTKKKTTVCKECGCETLRLHNTYNRTIQTLPIRMKTTYIHVKAYKYKCMNENCNTKVIMEDLNFASPSQVKSDDLICTILGISAFLSNEGASKVLKHLGIKVSNDTIKRLCDNIIIEDNVNVEAIGVDDVATRKGQTYATAIYDMNDHHLIALLDGRDGKTFKEWLKGHTKINKITRDRASNLASAINEVLPNCVQIADRFHLLQNLLEYLKEIFKNELPKEIVIQDGKIVEEPKKVISLATIDQKILEKLNYDNTPPVNENGEIIEFDSTIANKKSKQYESHRENRKKNNS